MPRLASPDALHFQCHLDLVRARRVLFERPGPYNSFDLHNVSLPAME